MKTLIAWVLLLGLLTTGFIQPVRKNPYKIQTIVLDAGHGGKDPGAIGTNKNMEKNVALAIALEVGKMIKENYPDVKVVYSRTKDVFVELTQRAAIANKNNADLFICIHCNAMPKGDTSTEGTETFCMGLHKTAGNLQVAMRENSVILQEENYQQKYEGFNPNSPESYIMFSLYQNAYLEQSLDLASKVQEKFTSRGRADRGVKQAGFLVLWKTAMPSVLIETGFITTPKEEKFLASEDGQQTIAESIFSAFKEYKTELESEK